MGLLRKKKRRGGLGPLALLALGGVAVLGGGGTYIADTIGSISPSCASITQQLGLGSRMCGDINQAVRHAGQALPDTSRLTASLGDIGMPMDFSALTRHIDTLTSSHELNNVLSPELASYIDTDLLRQFNRQSNGLGDRVLNDTQRMSLALSNTAVGRGMLRGGNGLDANPVNALKWFERGAEMGEYGILSQLSLGSMYSGQGGIAPDFRQAEHYQRQALQSLEALQRADTAEAQALLQNLPASPDEVKQRLEQNIRSLSQR